jgi:hypothetical protein
MKKPSLSDARSQKPAPAPEPAESEPAAAAKREARVITSVRLLPEELEALKIIAAKERCRVNDLFLEGVAHIFAVRNIKS